MRLPFILLSLALMPVTVTAQHVQDGQTPQARQLTASLFVAIREHDANGVTGALAKGAAANGRNWLGITPLMWATVCGDRTAVDYLLTHGAKLEDASPYGTAFTFALIGRHEKLALALLAKGAQPHPQRVDGATPLMLAAANGYADVIRQLLLRKEDPDIADVEGDTALIYAARAGQTTVAQQLVKAGAALNAVDLRGRTALMEASANGRRGCVDMLLAHHATVNARDAAGNNALLLAARYSGDPQLVASLLRSGAGVDVRDGKGNTAITLAAARGYTEATARLRDAGADAVPRNIAASTQLSAKRAIEASVSVLQVGMRSFAERTQCLSCHHQGLGLMALGMAQDKGFAADGKLVGSYLQHMGEQGRKGAPLIHQALGDAEVAKTVPAVDIDDLAIGVGYLFGGLAANHVPANPGLGEMALLTAAQQATDGHWGYGIDREPIQSSSQTTTALVLRVLRAYAPAEQADQMAARYRRAGHWLLTAPRPNTEDKASCLLGLKWAGVVEGERTLPLRELLAAQRADGGWSQLTSMSSDAYATGLALYALHVGGGIPTTDPIYQRGVRFLLRTQDEDGSWYVSKRTMPANNYFDAGFPQGTSQFTSFGATCWATMALLQAVEPSRTTVQ